MCVCSPVVGARVRLLCEPEVAPGLTAICPASGTYPDSLPIKFYITVKSGWRNQFYVNYEYSQKEKVPLILTVKNRKKDKKNPTISPLSLEQVSFFLPMSFKFKTWYWLLLELGLGYYSLVLLEMGFKIFFKAKCNGKGRNSLIFSRQSSTFTPNIYLQLLLILKFAPGMHLNRQSNWLKFGKDSYQNSNSSS